MRSAIFLFLSLFLTGCGGNIKYYACEDREKNCAEMPVNSGKEKNTVIVGIDTDGGYPHLAAERPRIFLKYVCKPSDINNLKYLGVRLFVDGKEIAPDSSEYTAVYITHVGEPISFDEKDCCKDLGTRLGVNVEPSYVEHSDRFHSVRVDVMKDFISLDGLPEKLTYIVTAETDKGTTEMERTVVLATREGSEFIRIH